MSKHQHPWDEFRAQVMESIRSKYGIEEAELMEPPKGISADACSPVCFSLARQLKKSPVDIAKEFSLENKYLLVEKVEAANGHLNFFINWKEFGKLAVKSVKGAGDDYGKSKRASGKVLVEFPSVNPNKPWHIGHVRNAVLGDTVSKILASAGHEVSRIDLINDLGLQVAKVYWGINNLKPSTNEKYDQMLGRLYVEVEKAAAGSPAIESKVREIMRDMEAGNNATSSSARKMAEACVQAQYQTAITLGIFHDYMIWESDIAASKLLEDAKELMLRCQNIRKETEGEKAGCIVADMSEFEEFKKLKDPLVVLFRSDGTATYTAKDIALQLWKFGLLKPELKWKKFTDQPGYGPVWTTSSGEGRKKNVELKVDKVINVVGMEQAHPQRLVYLILKVMGFQKEYEKSFHLAYEHVWLPTGKFSGRKGTWVGYSADEILAEAVTKAEAEIEKKNPGMPSDEKKKIAAAVGLGAVRYAMVKSNPDKKITFVWDEVLSFDGNAAPYLQYAHARMCRILEKAGKTKAAKSPVYEFAEAEKELLKHISKFPSVVADVALGMRKEVWGTRMEINKISEYAYELATKFSQFYRDCRVLGSEQESGRLAIVDASRQTLKNALNLLGIAAIERM